jgi:hypothetical protein
MYRFRTYLCSSLGPNFTNLDDLHGGSHSQKFNTCLHAVLFQVLARSRFATLHATLLAVASVGRWTLDSVRLHLVIVLAPHGCGSCSGHPKGVVVFVSWMRRSECLWVRLNCELMH